MKETIGDVRAIDNEIEPLLQHGEVEEHSWFG